MAIPAGDKVKTPRIQGKRKQARPVTAEEALEGRVGLQQDHKPCDECGLLPLYFKDEFGQIVRVDGCLGGLLGKVFSACCGHGGRKPAYVRVQVGTSSIDICGGKVIPYAEFTEKDESLRSV